MSKLLLLYCVLLFGVTFLFFPDTLEPKDWFLFSGMKLHFATHVYFITERIVMMILSWMIYTEATKYRKALLVFFVLMCCDLVDYLLRYNQVWFRFEGIPVSMNVVSVIVFGIVILNEWKKQLQ